MKCGEEAVESLQDTFFSLTLEEVGMVGWREEGKRGTGRMLKCREVWMGKRNGMLKCGVKEEREASGGEMVVKV